MKPTVFSVTSIDRVASRLQAIRHDGLEPTLAIVFSDLVHDLNGLQALFAKDNIALFGASSSGEFTHEGVVESSIAVMLLTTEVGGFQVEIFDGSTDSASGIGRAVVQWLLPLYDDPALMILSAGLHANVEHIIDQIAITMERKIPIFGGFAGSRTDDEKPMVFNEAQAVDNGIAVLAFDRRQVGIYGVAASGWKGIGTPKTITKSEGNIIYRIDDEPALDMYNKYLNIGGDPTLAYEYPLLLLREDGSSILRGSVSVNDDKSISYGGTVPQGTQVRFSIPPGLEIIDRAVDIVSHLNRQVPVADAIVLFSCKGRQFTLGPMVEDEITAIQQLWNVPMVGFFTNGEFGPMTNGRCELHNHTLVPVIIKQVERAKP